MSALVWDDAPPGSPLVVFLHANGFNAATYGAALAPVSLRARIVAFDFRGHGQTTLAADPKLLSDWELYRDDILVVFDELVRDGPIIFAGHSLGAAVSLLVAGAREVHGLFLIEPVILPDWARWLLRGAALAGIPNEISRMTAAAARRRKTWPSVEAAIGTYKDRAAFRNWQYSVLHAYVTAGMRRIDDGTVELRCDPGWEAATYMAQSRDLWRTLPKVDCPVRIVAGTRGSTFPPILARLTRGRLSQAHVDRIPGTSHFLPMERPDAVAAALGAFLERLAAP